MEKKPSKPIERQQWLDLADQALYRLKELITLAPDDDPRLLRAIQETFDRAYGKPTESIEHSGKDGAVIHPILIQVVRPEETDSVFGLPPPSQNSA